MEYRYSIIILNGKYKMLGISKDVLDLFGNPEMLSLFICAARHELLICLNDNKRESLSMKYAEKTKDFYWFNECSIFVNKMENELGIFREFVAVRLEGMFAHHQFFGFCLQFDTSSPSYVQLGYENMPPTIEQHYPKLSHLYNNAFRI